MYVDLDGHPLLVALIVVVFEQSCLSCIIISDFEKAKEDCCVCQKCMRSWSLSKKGLHVRLHNLSATKLTNSELHINTNQRIKKNEGVLGMINIWLVTSISWLESQRMFTNFPSNFHFSLFPPSPFLFYIISLPQSTLSPLWFFPPLPALSP